MDEDGPVKGRLYFAEGRLPTATEAHGGGRTPLTHPPSLPLFPIEVGGTETWVSN
jgi:hypothetical protein